jgi:hypothetical protein
LPQRWFAGMMRDRHALGRSRMPLRIIGAGFGRTGTASLHIALRQLGYPCYHMFEVLENKANKTHLRFWLDVAMAPEGAQHDWEKVFEHYTAAVDFPAAAVWRELLAAYPSAKVILTLHPKGAATWYESTYETIYSLERMWQVSVLKYMWPFLRNLSDMEHNLIWQRALKGTMKHRDKAIARYNELIEEVKSSVPHERLLVFSVDEGWEPLCRFLGIAVPSTPFPNINERAQMKRRMAGVQMVFYAVLAAVALAAAALGYGVIKVLG